MADLVIGGAWQALDGNGDPLPGAKAYFYDTGTTNARTTYQDSGAVTPHADPVVADANGFFPEVFVIGGTAVKCVLKTSADVTVTTQDPCLRINVSSSASAVSFTPTAEIAQTNVQDAIEQVQTNLEAGAFTNVSITGNLTFGGTALIDITGADTKLVSGTAGSNTDFGLWNADGDLVGGSMTYTRGSLIVGGAAAWGKLAVGTSGQVLTSDGTDAAWASPSSGMTFLSSVDLANDATADFTLTAGYDAYVFELQNVTPATDATSLWVRTSTDGGSTFDSGASDYAYSGVLFASDGSSVTEVANADSKISTNDNGTAKYGIGSDVAEDGVSGRFVVSGAHLAKTTILNWHYGFQGAIPLNAVFNTSIGGGVRRSQADVDAVRFLFSSGNLESGTITLWGMKNA